MGKEILDIFKKLQTHVKPKIKGIIHKDEKYIHVGKEHGYDLNAIASKSKYIHAHLYAKERDLEACVKFLRQIKITRKEQIMEVYNKERHKPVKKRKLITFVSDRFENYRNAFNKLFYRTCKLRFGAPIACRKYGLEHNNNSIERYNGDINDRIKTMRGGFGSHEGAEYFLDIRLIFHNFINPHMSLKGKTPAEEAEVDLKLGRNKLLNLIKYVALLGDDK